MVKERAFLTLTATTLWLDTTLLVSDENVENGVLCRVSQIEPHYQKTLLQSRRLNQ